ncbi:hypothetical protein NADFUDRAFT_51049 [Nadsonia fulvescens var. elongata DSM 6958]|uniref:DNA-binding protein RAP1 n=1 Tax=Nadsonia fulvescens var. elongata DSM 6958 TaxID=857566 RepID=A0A1E3PKE2_9ASCO|nr:hypothetical protein NADFUDRAFT_51049 [Nadsonia fulvescens var. elongata DSM 6958]
MPDSPLGFENEAQFSNESFGFAGNGSPQWPERSVGDALFESDNGDPIKFHLSFALTDRATLAELIESNGGAVVTTSREAHYLIRNPADVKVNLDDFYTPAFIYDSVQSRERLDPSIYLNRRSNLIQTRSRVVKYTPEEDEFIAAYLSLYGSSSGSSSYVFERLSRLLKSRHTTESIKNHLKHTPLNYRDRREKFINKPQLHVPIKSREEISRHLETYIPTSEITRTAVNLSGHGASYETRLVAQPETIDRNMASRGQSGKARQMERSMMEKEMVRREPTEEGIRETGETGGPQVGNKPDDGQVVNAGTLGPSLQKGYQQTQPAGIAPVYMFGQTKLTGLFKTPDAAITRKIAKVRRRLEANSKSAASDRSDVTKDDEWGVRDQMGRKSSVASMVSQSEGDLIESGIIEPTSDGIGEMESATNRDYHEDMLAGELLRLYNRMNMSVRRHSFKRAWDLESSNKQVGDHTKDGAPGEGFPEGGGSERDLSFTSQYSFEY